MSRIENAIKTIEYFDQGRMNGSYRMAENNVIAVAKSEKILPEIISLLNSYGEKNGKGQIERVTRQRLRLGEREIKLVRAQDAAKWLEEDCDFAITTISALSNWAISTNQYQSWQELVDDYEICGLGIGKCTVEVACRTECTDLIDAYKVNGLLGIQELAKTKNDYRNIRTDLGGITRYFFPRFFNIKDLDGSVELTRDPLIVTVVETGNSLKDEGWTRLSDFRKEAVLINSQTCIIRERR